MYTVSRLSVKFEMNDIINYSVKSLRIVPFVENCSDFAFLKDSTIHTEFNRLRKFGIQL